MKAGDVIEGRYRIERLLGKGGMGAVFLAFDQTLDKWVAVKTLLPEMLLDLRAANQLKEEVKLAQDLRHPSICGIHDYRGSWSEPYLVMEYVEGETLSNFIYRQPGHRCDEATFRRLAGEILAAIECAHNAGVIHRDLKSSNIMVRPDGSVRVMDFGIAARLKETYSRTTGSPVSLSVHYASPEQINGQKPAPTMDIYSLGCVFYEMLAGEPPFTQGDVLHQQLTRPPDPIPGVSSHLNTAILASLQKDPSRRPSNAAEYRAMLAGHPETIRIPRPTTPSQPPRPAPQPSALPTAPSPSSRRKWLPLLAVGCAICALLLVGVGVWSSRSFPSGQIMSAPRGSIVTPSQQTELGSRGNMALSSGQTDSRSAQIAWMEFVRVRPVEFQMGCSPSDSDCEGDEKPAHRVRITRGFELGKYEVTQAQWESVMGTNPSNFKGADRPVEQVSWDDAQVFLTRLNQKNDGHHYRLPTEAEWEYAARAGSSEKHTGPLDGVAWYNANSGNQTHPVGQKRANGWGLYDMQGNVWEWCADWYYFYTGGSPEENPSGPSWGQFRVLRGGSWLNDALHLRVSSRGRIASGSRFSNIGLRCVREVR